MGQLLKNLAVALLNATLLLAAVCLFFLWQLSKTVDGVAANFAKNLEIVTPLRDEVLATREEISGLRADIAALGSGDSALGDAARARLEARSAQIETKLDGMQDRMNKLAEAPERMIDHAITTAAEAFGAKAAELRGCTMPGGNPAQDVAG